MAATLRKGGWEAIDEALFARAMGTARDRKENPAFCAMTLAHRRCTKSAIPSEGANGEGQHGSMAPASLWAALSCAREALGHLPRSQQQQLRLYDFGAGGGVVLLASAFAFGWRAFGCEVTRDKVSRTVAVMRDAVFHNPASLTKCISDWWQPLQQPAGAAGTEVSTGNGRETGGGKVKGSALHRLVNTRCLGALKSGPVVHMPTCHVCEVAEETGELLQALLGCLQAEVWYSFWAGWSPKAKQVVYQLFNDSADAKVFIIGDRPSSLPNTSDLPTAELLTSGAVKMAGSQSQLHCAIFVKKQVAGGYRRRLAGGGDGGRQDVGDTYERGSGRVQRPNGKREAAEAGLLFTEEACPYHGMHAVPAAMGKKLRFYYAEDL